ncbi:glycosyltransferase family 2 protein [Halobacillus sp. B29]|uniref:glycosyltransferase family 2 protein n=1 Tax=Halobacillus sp. B29 TaxID=3457432 RepID=UPI003FCE1FD3
MKNSYNSQLVSIIMPAYNSEKYINEAITSVAKQTYQNWELLIIDDCSHDKTIKTIKNYNDNRIKLITLKDNSGVANARNVGISTAKGRYLAFLDSDDKWDSNKLSKQLDFMKRHKYSFTFTSYEWIDEYGNRLNKKINAPKEVDYKNLLYGNPIGCLTVLIDRFHINDIKMPNIKHEDYATWLNVLKMEKINAYGMQESLAYYRKTSSSLSSNKLKTIFWTWNIYRSSQCLSVSKSIKCLYMYIYKTSKKNLGL